MVIKEGYKQTEIGVIPIDWEIFELNNLIDSNRSIRYGIVQPGKFDPNGRFMVRGQDYSFGWVDSNQMFRVSPEIEERYKNARLTGGDIILTIVGAGTGKLEVVPNWLNGSNITQTTARIAIDSNKADSNYCKFYFQTNAGKTQINLYIKGAAQPGLNIRDIRTFLIPLPPSKEEQTAIANTLSDTDGLITGLEKLIAKKQNIKQGAMQQLLQPKEGWEVKKLGDVITNFQNGYGFSAIGYVKSGIPIITMAQIGLDGSFNFDESKVNFWKPEDFSMLKNFHIKNGDLIIAMTDVTPEKNLIGRMAIVKTNRTLLLNQRVGLLRLDNTKVNAYFLKTLSNMRVWRTYCIGSASLGVQANIGTKDILNGELSLPNINEQNKIAEILYDMDTEINALKQKLEKYKKVKLGMMQELLTGKTRLV